MVKKDVFITELQQLAEFGRLIAHPARLAILQYLAETKTCISGDISEYIPLSRTTVSQHLKELKALGLIHGDIDGVKVNYCLCASTIEKYRAMMDDFFKSIEPSGIQCCQ